MRPSRPGVEERVEGWGRGAAKGTLILAVSFFGFVLVPNKLLAFLPLHGVAPRPRDAIVAAWAAIWFVATAKLFLRLQRMAPR